MKEKRTKKKKYPKHRQNEKLMESKNKNQEEKEKENSKVIYAPVCAKSAEPKKKDKSAGLLAKWQYVKKYDTNEKQHRP